MPDAPMPPVFRFAPSPNGRLHLGHAYSALFTSALAQAHGGRFLLRIEDIDLLRSRTEHVDGIFEDLAWLGLTWEEPVRRQSAHFDEYRACLNRLIADGLVYPCFATRNEITQAVGARFNHPKDPDGQPLYPGLSKQLSSEEQTSLMDAGKPFALRLDMGKALARVARRLTFSESGEGPGGEYGEVEAHPDLWGDVILGRKDVRTSYHLSVVLDDAVQGVSHVTRGQDLFYATAIHRLLQALLDLPTPHYHHHRLIREVDSGRKLAKSASDLSLRELRDGGIKAEDIRHELGFD